MMKTPAFKHLDFHGIPGRVLLVGDVHGCFTHLLERLRAIEFDGRWDRLVFLGDLIDRGAESDQAGAWCSYDRIVGNHEDMCWRGYGSDAPEGEKGYWQYVHGRNGGFVWDERMGARARTSLADRLMDAPHALEILTPAGRKIGIAHARVPGNDWDKFKSALIEDDDGFGSQTVAKHDSLWDRGHIEQYMQHGDAAPVAGIDPGIDHVFFGHTILPKAIPNRNCTWMDTGAYKYNNLTILDADKFLSGL